MLLLDQRIDAAGSLLTCEASTHLADQGCCEFLPTSLGRDRESIDVAAPSVPSSDDGANDAPGRVGRDQKDGRAFIDSTLNFVERIGNAGGGVGIQPELENSRAIGARTVTHSNRIIHNRTLIRMRNIAAILLLVATLGVLPNGYSAAMAGDMDGIMMQNGKVMMMKAGKAAGPMTSDMTMANGTKVTTAGLMIMKDGTQVEMKDGQMMMMDGKIMEGGKAMGMTNQ